jgi:hypothetical protein
VNVFAPIKVNDAAPFFTNAPPTPLITSVEIDAEPVPIVSVFPCKFTVPVPVAFKTDTC